MATKKEEHLYSILFFRITYSLSIYFLKKSGILIDCSFTPLVTGLDCCIDGAVPPIGLAVVLPSYEGTVLFAPSPEGRIDPTFCCPSNLAFNFDELPPTLCKPVAITVIVASSDLESS